MADIVTQTIDLARRSRLPIDEICIRAGIKRRWFHKFKAGGFKDPGVGKVTRLNRVLRGLPVEPKAA